MALVGLGVAVAADDQGRRRSEPPDDVLQRLDRDLGAMEVLEDQDERLAARDPRERACQKLEDLDAVLWLLLLAGCGRARFTGDGRAQLRDLRQLGEESDQLRRKVGKVRALARGGGGGGRVPGPKVVLDELTEALVRKGAGLLDERP
jgi:hypothetical protein